jgi:CBS domain containing-hemolysin-like protein
MVQLIIAAILAMLFLLTLAVRRVYYCVPAKELKRLARENDAMGSALYKAVAFEGSLAVLLWLFAGAFASASFVLLALSLPIALAAVVIAVVLWVGFGWVTSSFPRSFMLKLTASISPMIAGILSHTHSVLGRVSHFIRNHQQVFDHTGLYEKEDFIDLLAKQKSQPDSRVAQDDVELIERALAFGEKTVSDITLPRKDVRIVRLSETIGPKLMDELHKSKQQIFPVSDEKGEQIIGMVRLEDLVKARQGGAVKSVADEAVYFVREDFSLAHVLDVFRQTKQRLLVVINNFEEFLGVVSLDTLVDQLMGKQIEPVTENIYGDRSAVAAFTQPELEVIPEPVESIPEEPGISENSPEQIAEIETETKPETATEPEFEAIIDESVQNTSTPENQENATSDSPEVVK